MPGHHGIIAISFLGLMLAQPAAAIDASRDFSGHWVLDARSSNTRTLGAEPEAILDIAQQDIFIQIAVPVAGAKPVEWFYSLSGAEARYILYGESRNSIAKWEGAALLINTLVSSPRNYTVMDRWRLSRDRETLTIVRQIVRRAGQVEGTLVYRRGPVATPPSPPVVTEAPPEPVEARREPERLQPARPLRPVEPAPPPEPVDYVVRAGTRIPLSLRNAVDTRHSHEGDHIYLETSMPVSDGERVVVVQGSFVNGTLTLSKPAGKVKGKAELFIRFDSLMLPNGVTREFHSRLGSADANARGQVDSEGKVTGERDSRGDARDVALGTGVGATVGGVAGSAAGHPLGGLGIGAAAGGGAGLATVLLSKRPDVVLPRGTTLEMILDRDLHFTLEELRRPRRF